MKIDKFKPLFHEYKNFIHKENISRNSLVKCNSISPSGLLLPPSRFTILANDGIIFHVSCTKSSFIHLFMLEINKTFLPLFHKRCWLRGGLMEIVRLRFMTEVIQTSHGFGFKFFAT